MLGTPQGGSYPSPNDAMAAAGILASSAAAAAAAAAANPQQHQQQQQYKLPPPMGVPLQPQQQQPQQQAPAAVGGAAASAQQYMLQWHEHHDSFFRLMEELCQSQAMTDVTVACGDVSLEAHSLILSASSPILRSILAKGNAGWPGRKQTLHFMDMNPTHMQLLLQYMYRGEVNVQQAQLGPLMQSAKALQIKGLCSTSPDDKTFNDFSAAAHQNIFNNTQGHTINVPSVPAPAQAPPQLPPSAVGVASMAGGTLHHYEPDVATAAVGTPNGGGATVAAKNKKRKSDWNEGGGDDEGRGGGARRRSKSTKKSAMSPGGTVQSPTSTSSAGHAGDGALMVKTEEGNKVMGEVGMVVDEDAKPAGAGLNASGNDEEALNGSSGTSMENWSEQPTMKVKGHRIPVLPKPLSQMKTTETRSYLSRLIWATNDWKRPQYGNPDTKPIWWPNYLLNWSEMKKMGGKKSAGLTNVNYNEIQKNILNEGYKYFGFDPETLWTNVASGQQPGGSSSDLTRTQEKLCHMIDPAAAAAAAAATAAANTAAAQIPTSPATLAPGSSHLP